MRVATRAIHNPVFGLGQQSSCSWLDSLIDPAGCANLTANSAPAASTDTTNTAGTPYAPIAPGSTISTGITVSGVPVGTPTAAQAAQAQSQYSSQLLSSLPLTGGPDDTNPYALPTTFGAITGGVPSGSATPPSTEPLASNWGVVALIVAGAFVVLLAVKK